MALKKLAGKLALAAGLVASLGMSTAHALDKITVAYFLEWPTANQAAQIDKTYDEALGLEVEWRAFGNGNEMVQAMVSGDVQIAYSNGFVPFVVGVSSGAPIKLVGVAVTYAENDLCIVRNDSGITKANAKELEGKKVATPIGNVTHYKLIRTLDHLGVDINKVNLVQMNPADAAVAVVRGDVVMGCAFGGALDRMKTVGTPLMTGAEQEAVGINTFDVVNVTNDFAAEHPDLVKKFMEVTNQANTTYNSNPDAVYDKIALAAGMDLEPAKKMIANFGFPTSEEQLQENWLGGGIQAAAKGVADVMVSAGGLDEALDDYSQFVDASYLK
ncbi:Taurine-binding periplasmic protein [Pseudovibrio sp. FO-BEG1]|uniref:Taurine transport system substrate-binding protein n=1 Tax=Pseudovibrio denitrificans TaxID=258256 RepID=A0A1I7CSH2_9HYPH|nr:MULTISPECIES: ABC transporter substrate-binding protein [Pseudovibrio]AEV35447.1 Taurine-binding periplasmic protein [Pseudovibrio sp. FO-BEG1]EEA95141.1 taurine ABC transporter, periplasmic taurine-binding protein [Pseudovibrio sp. JE062]SFU02329.1 taurine transport system substrate-binding protein [Pseudovibrio denitrificans]